MDMPNIKIDLREQREKIFIIIVIVITIFIGRKILDGQQAKLNITKDRINQYKQGIELATEINSLKQELTKFNNAGWQTSESVSIMGAVNEVASKYNIEIIAFDPGGLRDEQQYLVLTMVLSIRGDYSSLAQFLSALEELNTLTKVYNLQITPTGNTGSNNNPILQASVNIAAFILKK